MKCEYPYCWKMAMVFHTTTGTRVRLEHKPRLERALAKTPRQFLREVPV